MSYGMTSMGTGTLEKEKAEEEIKKIIGNQILNFERALLNQKIEDDKKITYIIYKYNEHQDRMINKIDRKIGRIVGKNKKTRIILSKEIKETCKDKKEHKHIYSLIKYYEGNKQIFNDCIEEILENVIKIQNETKEEQSIYILAKSNQVKNENRIINMLFNYKAINIVTPNIKDFKDIWVFRKDVDIKDLRFTDGEVEESKWVTIDEFEKMIKRKEIVPTIDFTKEDYKKCLEWSI